MLPVDIGTGSGCPRSDTLCRPYVDRAYSQRLGGTQAAKQSHPGDFRPASIALAGAAASTAIRPNFWGWRRPSRLIDLLQSVPNRDRRGWTPRTGSVFSRTGRRIRQVRLKTKDVLGLAEGSVIKLDKAVGDYVEIIMNQQRFARGEVIIINDTFGVRVVAVNSAQKLMLDEDLL